MWLITTTTTTTTTTKVLLRVEKMSDQAKRVLISPACIAGVRVSRPNFKARCGRMKL